MENNDRSGSRAERMKRMFEGLQELEKSSLFQTPPLSEAIYNRDVAEVARLLDEGADVNESRRFHGTPLVEAVQYGSSSAIRELRSISEGFDRTVQKPAATKDVLNAITNLKLSAGSVRQ